MRVWERIIVLAFAAAGLAGCASNRAIYESPPPEAASSAMLTTDEIMQARAQHMVSTDSNSKIHYQGNAVAWQGSNRVEADRLDIDRAMAAMKIDIP